MVQELSKSGGRWKVGWQVLFSWHLSAHREVRVSKRQHEYYVMNTRSEHRKTINIQYTTECTGPVQLLHVCPSCSSKPALVSFSHEIASPYSIDRACSAQLATNVRL